MALVWFKSIDRIIEEGGERIEGSREYFYDRRASDSMTTDMMRRLEASLGPHKSKNPFSRDFKAPMHFGIVDDGYNWYAPWVKLWIPTGFIIKVRL